MPETPPPVDTVTKPAAEPPKPSPEEVSDKVKKRVKNILMVLIGIPYVIYILWCLFLITIFPSPTGEMQSIVQMGVLSAIVGACVLLALGAFAFMRVAKAVDVSERVRMMGLIRIGIFVIPGLLISGAVPFLITREPPLYITITDPTRAEDLVAPLSVTFNLEEAVEILGKKGLKPVEYAWDFNGDGEKDEDTILPVATAYYDRQGAYNVVARIALNDRSTRRVVRRLVIPRAVFSVTPLRPVVDEPIRFSIAHLIEDPKNLREVQWDFDEDGNADEVTTEMSVVHTYHRTEPVKVSAIVLLQTGVQNVYERTIQINEPEPLPFPVEIASEPTYLLSPAPFGTLFRIETEEPVAEVVWDFGDGEEATGTRVGHTFERRGAFLVMAKVRSEEGDIAKLTKLVRVTETLRIGDLVFDGSPEVRSFKIEAEVPVTIDLTPRTSLPLIKFLWEAPEASSIGSTEKQLQAIYRRPGTYIITLIGEDPDGRAMRQPITLEVTPVTSLVSIKMTPEGGVAPLDVRFDASETVIPEKEISGFEWTFGDKEDEVPRQAGAIVDYRYDVPGTYEVKLVTHATDGSSYDTSKTIVVRPPVLDACFLSSRTSGKAPMGVTFNMKCTTGKPVSITWDFGDGAQADERNPVHVFERSGEFEVVLTLKDEAGSISTESVTITVTE